MVEMISRPSVTNGGGYGDLFVVACDHHGVGWGVTGVEEQLPVGAIVVAEQDSPPIALAGAGVLDGCVGSVGEEIEGDEIRIVSESPQTVVGSGIALDELKLAGAGRAEPKASGWIQLFKHRDFAAG